MKGWILDIIDLYDSDLQYCDLRSVNAHFANFGSSNLEGADLSGSIFMGAYFGHARLFSVKLNKSNLRHANFQDSRFEGANFEGAELSKETAAYLSKQHARLENVRAIHEDGSTSLQTPSARERHSQPPPAPRPLASATVNPRRPRRTGI
jgi:uncharacterized protein YjbI with pentapeptide repeats